MKFLQFSWYAVCAGTAGALLAACALRQAQGDMQQPIAAPRLDSQTFRHGTTQSQTFTYAGSEQTFKVPSGVTQITTTASGATGGLSSRTGANSEGGLVRATVSVTPRESLPVFVGGDGYKGGGYNGGGEDGAYSSSYSAGGGGACEDNIGGGGCKTVSGGTSYTGPGGGGGGGSSYVEKGATHILDRKGGAPAGNGEVVITWQTP